MLTGVGFHQRKDMVKIKFHSLVFPENAQAKSPVSEKSMDDIENRRNSGNMDRTAVLIPKRNP